MEHEEVSYILGQINAELMSIKSNMLQINTKIDNNMTKSELCRRMVYEHELKINDITKDIENKSNWKASVFGGLIVGVPSWITMIYMGINLLSHNS